MSQQNAQLVHGLELRDLDRGVVDQGVETVGIRDKFRLGHVRALAQLPVQVVETQLGHGPDAGIFGHFGGIQDDAFPPFDALQVLGPLGFRDARCGKSRSVDLLHHESRHVRSEQTGLARLGIEPGGLVVVPDFVDFLHPIPSPHGGLNLDGDPRAFQLAVSRWMGAGNGLRLFGASPAEREQQFQPTSPGQDRVDQITRR